MKNRPTVYGVSSYLVVYKKQVYLCTAKHLTRAAGGFEPPIDLKSFQDSVNYFKSYPRTNRFSSDTVHAKQLKFFNDELDDFIALTVQNVPKSIGVLKPNFEKLKKGTRVRFLGCEYEDRDCSQKEYFGTVSTYTAFNQLEIMADSSNISLPGFSGAPVLDEENRVVGHIIAGALADGKFLLYVAPMSLLRKVLE